MPKKITVVVAGCGARGRFAYAPYSKEHPDQMQIVGAADLIPERLKLMAEDYSIPAGNCFPSAEELFSHPKLADMAFICTQDRDHVSHACAALEQGYDVLLEKPISPDPAECQRLSERAEALGRRVTVCHVLRYTPFYRALKRLLEEGTIGEVVNINAAENVAYWHQAHSFVRGNWRNTAQSSPMILAKCCHDMDILLWLAGRECLRVSSFGGNYLFRPEKAPEGAATRCNEGCRCQEDCPYDAEKIYLTNPNTGFEKNPKTWLANVLCGQPSPDSLREALHTGPYGRCVYHCDNDVVDHQQVNLELAGGVTISLSMCAFSDKCYRTIQIMGTMGEINGNIETETITVSRFGRPAEVIDLNVNETLAGHGGGDGIMIQQLMELEAGTGAAPTSLAQSVESHYAALAAEESRNSGGRVVELKEFSSRKRP